MNEGTKYRFHVIKVRDGFKLVAIPVIEKPGDEDLPALVWNGSWVRAHPANDTMKPPARFGH